MRACAVQREIIDIVNGCGVGLITAMSTATDSETTVLMPYYCIKWHALLSKQQLKISVKSSVIISSEILKLLTCDKWQSFFFKLESLNNFKLKRQIKKWSPTCALSCGSLKLYCIFLLFVIVLWLANLIFGLHLKLSSLSVFSCIFSCLKKKLKKTTPNLIAHYLPSSKQTKL